MRFKTSFRTLSECNEIRERFSEYVDGILSEEERICVHDHLKFCPSCSDHLDDFCKTLSILVEFREECLPDSIREFRLPRSTFVEVFPSIRKEDPPPSLAMWAPYVYAVVLLSLLASGWELAYRHTYVQFYNTSNYTEVVAKI